MNDSKDIAHRVRELFLNGKWIANTNYKHCLESTPWQLAIQKHSKNSIAELAQHVHYYLKGVMEALQGKPLLVKDKYSFDFDEIKNEKEWKNFQRCLWEDAEKFAVVIEQLNEEVLHSDFVKKEYGSNKRNINAIIEHGYYHLGQIVLIKKQLNQDH